MEMRLWVLLTLMLGWAQAQPDNQQALNRCQAVFSDLKPQFLYLERAGEERFFIRVVLGRTWVPLVRMTVSIELTPVPIGLEDLAVQYPRSNFDPKRFVNFVERRFEAIMQDVNLGNWITLEPNARSYRCFLLYQGRQIGVLRMTRNYQPIPELRLIQAYRRAPLRYPLLEPANPPQQ